MNNFDKMFFNKDRWEYAISKAIDKGIDKSVLYQICKPEIRLSLAKKIMTDDYEIMPPHTAKIPKDNGDFRTVYINEPLDRVLLSIVNDLLFDTMGDMVHPKCKSYLTGVGCGKVVTEASREICKVKALTVNGWKSDLSKYFDSVPIQYIDRAFDKVEQRFGKSMVISMLRKYYHCNLFFDTEGNLCNSYQSLKQGCSVASWLADVVLYDIDTMLNNLDGYYVRYSDDMLFIGADYEKAMIILTTELAKLGMKLNPKKVEYLMPGKWFKFLGFSINGNKITLSSTRIKTFQKEVENRTIKAKKYSLSNVKRYLYGNGEYSWATSVLPYINCEEDINTLNDFVLDCIRASMTGKTKVGGLGYQPNKVTCCIARGKGANVKHNREITPKVIEHFYTIGCMQKAIKQSRSVYDALVADMKF